MTARIGVLALALAACAGSELNGQIRTLDDLIKKNWEAAYKCAPRELAMAESHLAFAKQEVHEGDYYRARQELDVADINAKEAVRRSPPEKCLPQPIAERRDHQRRQRSRQGHVVQSVFPQDGRRGDGR